MLFNHRIRFVGLLLSLSLIVLVGCGESHPGNADRADRRLLSASAYVPGKLLTWNAYAAFYADFFAAFPRGDFMKVMSDWNSGLDREMTPALYEVFTNPASRAFYAGFSDPEARYAKGTDGKPALNARGEPYPNSFDRGQGLRVVWQLTQQVPGAPDSPPQARLISVITFWHFNFSTGLPELVAGHDSLRIRTQLTDFISKPLDDDPGQGIPRQDPGQGMAGLSYATAQNQGVITALVPSPPIALQPNSNDPSLHRNITGASLPVACASCHRDRLSRVSYSPVDEATQKRSRDLFLGYLKDHGLSANETLGLEKKMSDPSALQTLFRPAGLVDTLAHKLTP